LKHHDWNRLSFPPDCLFKKPRNSANPGEETEHADDDVEEDARRERLVTFIVDPPKTTVDVRASAPEDE